MTDQKLLSTGSSIPKQRDDWQELRQFTRARIGLSRSGNAQCTKDVLAFQESHSKARDAVHIPLDVAHLQAEMEDAPVICVSSQAQDRQTYLRRPDLGCRLNTASLEALPHGEWDVVFVAADGLSSIAIQKEALPLYRAMCQRLVGWRIAPLVVAMQSRVALGDEIAQKMGAKIVVMMIGERPGLSVADSMGVYLTYAPYVGCPDSSRNCLSNIHTYGLSTSAAADKLTWLMQEAMRLKETGIGLKDSSPENGIIENTLKIS